MRWPDRSARRPARRPGPPATPAPSRPGAARRPAEQARRPLLRWPRLRARPGGRPRRAPPVAGATPLSSPLLEEISERLADEPVELGRQRPVRSRELTQVDEEVGERFEAERIAVKLLAREPLEIPEIPVPGLDGRARAEVDDARGRRAPRGPGRRRGRSRRRGGGRRRRRHRAKRRGVPPRGGGRG